MRLRDTFHLTRHKFERLMQCSIDGMPLELRERLVCQMHPRTHWEFKCELDNVGEFHTCTFSRDRKDKRMRYQGVPIEERMSVTPGQMRFGLLVDSQDVLAGVKAQESTKSPPREEPAEKQTPDLPR